MMQKSELARVDVPLVIFREKCNLHGKPILDLKLVTLVLDNQSSRADRPTDGRPLSAPPLMLSNFSRTVSSHAIYTDSPRAALHLVSGRHPAL